MFYSCYYNAVVIYMNFPLAQGLGDAVESLTKEFVVSDGMYIYSTFDYIISYFITKVHFCHIGSTCFYRPVFNY